ncbi:hypothetical protein J6590_050343 [Homalodisca vitripennis]|nr:hypothetical protein J6590_050343 [Homalodisca vitripennis]
MQCTCGSCYHFIVDRRALKVIAPADEQLIVNVGLVYPVARCPWLHQRTHSPPLHLASVEDLVDEEWLS